jgi:hypothetical protein
MAGLVMDVSGGLHDIEEVIHRLVVFEQAPDTQSGYFAWRFREVTTRPGAPFNGSAYGRLQAISSIVKADKELIARLTAQHGRFLETRPHLAQQAMRAEFDKIDLDDTWWSSDGALRRARAGLTFLRHAAVLAFGMEDRGEQMLPLVRQLTPPATALIRDAPRNVIAAISNLGRMITFVEELFSKDDAELAGLHESGRAELLALERGDFDFLAELPSASSQAPRPLLAGDLPFVVLPPGELLQSFLGELRATGSYLGGTVDFERVRVLEHLGDYFQGRRCTVYRGAFPSSGKDNGYVVLGIARARSQDEDAVAVSPWKGEHATFVVRHGCGSKLPWPTVLSRTKKEAKQLGARRLQFRVKLNRGMDVYEAMLQKVVALLECEPHEFDNGEVYFDHEDGCYRVREPDDFLGYSVTSDESTSPGASHDESSPNVLQRIWNWFGRS